MIFKRIYNNKPAFYKIIHILLAAFYVMFFFVIIQSSLAADDILNANAAACNYIPDDSVWKLTIRQWLIWFERGRFFPFSNYVYLLFAAMPSIKCYKLFLLILVYINSLLMGKCTEKLFHNKAVGILTMLIFPLSIQLTPIYDGPLYCYHGLMQLVLLGSEIGILCVFKYCDLHSRNSEEKSYIWILIAGAAAYMISLGMYEIAFVMASFIGLCTWCYTGSVKRSLKVLIPYICAYIFMLFMNFYMRTAFASDSYGGTTINLDLTAIVVTFFKQLISTFPFAGFFFGLASGDVWDKHLWLNVLKPVDLLMILIFIALLVIAVFVIKYNYLETKTIIFTLLSGLCLMVFPSIIIAITEKYQLELEWGRGYLPNYIQSFGLVLIILSIFILITRNFNNKGKLITTIIVILISVPMLLGQQAQARIDVESKYNDLGYNRDTAMNAIKAGLLDELDSDDYLFGTSGCPFDYSESRQFYTFAAKRYINAKESYELVPFLHSKYGEADCYNSIDDNTYVSTTYANSDGGYTMIGKCTSVTPTADYSGFESIYVENPKLYVTGSIPLDYANWTYIGSSNNGTIYQLTGQYEFPLN